MRMIKFRAKRVNGGEWGKEYDHFLWNHQKKDVQCIL